jgi:hypothetical protein
MNQILHTLYDLGDYDLTVNCNQKPEPLLADKDVKWAEQSHGK